MRLELVKRVNFDLEYASDELKNDREVVMKAVNQRGCASEYASDELRNDREVVMEAVKQNGCALKYASDEVKSENEKVDFAMISIRKQNSLQR